MDDHKFDQKPDLQPVAPSLKGAVRRARIEQAERSSVMAELRGAEIARLEMLAEALEPVFAQVPDHVDIFDAGVVPGAQPRLYVDMIAFVEMGPDKRVYQFVQNTRYGRVVAAASEKQDVIVESVTDYIARRLVEREQALAGDRTIEEAARAFAQVPTPAQTRKADAAPANTAGLATAPAPAAAAPAADAPRRGFWNVILDSVIFLAELIGFVVLLVALFGALYFAWTMGEAWWQSYFNKVT